MGATVTKRTRDKLRRLRSLLKDSKSVLIVLQDYPDPDAIAAAAAFRELVHASGRQPCTIAHGGVVGRAENRALVNYLQLSLQRIDQVEPSQFQFIVMLDAQPLSGNASLAPNTLPHAVIDHHPIRTATRKAAFHDVRNRYGATSTILHEYLEAAGICPTVPLATALLYGIRSDTNDLGRETSQADIEAYISLYPKSNKRMLGRIQMAPLSRDYFRLLASALESARMFGECVITGLGEIDNPDILSEMADLLLRYEGSNWAMCHGICAQKLLISLRTLDPNGNAGKVAARLAGRKGTGGGHGAMAGAQIPLDQLTKPQVGKLQRTVTSRLLRILKEDPAKGKSLV